HASGPSFSVSRPPSLAWSLPALLDVQPDGAVALAGCLVSADLKHRHLAQHAGQFAQQIDRWLLFTASPGGVHQYDGVEQRLGRQELLVEQSAFSDRLRLVIQPDPGGHLRRVADEVSEVVIARNDKLLVEPGAGGGIVIAGRH